MLLSLLWSSSADSMIQVLPESLVNKIAAGEVIVRPASVIKELVENSLDAGATRIAVDVGNGCRDLRVIDNGRGIGREEASLALVRHATSKIIEFDDLWTLSTRGFRGEALASISAVSRLQILTRPRGELAGCCVRAEGEGNVTVEPAGAPEGTDVRVRDLFFNTPARLKFMKSPGSEFQQILAIVTRQALIRPSIAFTVTHDTATVLDVPADQPWAERVAMLLGSQIAENLLEVEFERHGLRARGFILKPAVTRKDRRHQFFFVNGRPVTSRSLSFVVQQAYHGLVMTQRFPIVVLDVILPPGEVDINVHPTKEEVRFRNENAVNGPVHRAVSERLVAANLVPSMNLGGPADAPYPQMTGISSPANRQTELLGALEPGQWRGESSPRIPVDFTSLIFGHNAGPRDTSAATLARVGSEIASADAEIAAAVEAPAEQPAPQSGSEPRCDVRPLVASVSASPLSGTDSAEASAIFRGGRLPEPLGQIAQCYIIAQTGNDLLLIDQHAAHERLLYMKLASLRQSMPTQPLLLPVSVDVPATAMAYMHKVAEMLTSLGLQTEHFGGQTFVVQSVPADMADLDAAAVLADLLDDFEDAPRMNEVSVVRDRVITRMACRAAIKAGQNLHMDEMRALIRQVAEARLPFTCPHGRPTMILLTKDQLDRQFKRKL